jgi:hypothetical protein
MYIKLNKFYYKYINNSIINHYKLLILTEEYINISKKYLKKYPNAKSWINLNEKLFVLNKQAETDYIECSKKQLKIKKEFFKSHEIICKNCKNKEYIICSDYFTNFYIKQKYHYEQYIDYVIENIIKDIHNKK